MSENRMLLDEIRELKRRLQALETRGEHPGFAASDVARLSVANTFAGDQTIPNTGLHLLDTNASHDLIVKPGSDLSADRTLTVTTGDANRTVTLSGNLTVDAATTISTAAATVLDDATVAAMVDTLGGASSVGSGGLARATSPVFATQITTPAIVTASGVLTVTPAAGSGVSFALSAAGDFAVNTIQFVVDTSTGFSGFGTASPATFVDVRSNTAANNIIRIGTIAQGLSVNEQFGAIEFFNSDGSGAGAGVTAKIAALAASASAGQGGQISFSTKTGLAASVLTEWARLDSAGLMTLFGALQVDGNTTLGNASTDTITHTGRAIFRTVASDPQHATAGSRPAGSVAEIVYYAGKVYFCTNAVTPTWELITSA